MKNKEVKICFKIKKEFLLSVKDNDKGETHSALKILALPTEGEVKEIKPMFAKC